MDDLRHAMLDDGTDEVVDLHPARRPFPVRVLSQIASAPAHANLHAMRAPADEARVEFIMLRTQRGAARIALNHVPVFVSLVRAWTAKRADSIADPGCTVAEIAAKADVTVKAVRGILASLIRNGVVISKRSYVGWQGVTSAYYPTEVGAQALAIAEVLGYGAMIQVGRQPTAWAARNSDETPHLFQFASLIARQSDPGRPYEEATPI